MQQFLILFREPDGRKAQHTPKGSNRKITSASSRVEAVPPKVSWLEKVTFEKKLVGGMPLTLNGKVIKGKVTTGKERLICEGPHKVGEEIVGGYLLINAANLEEATAVIQSCPNFEFDGYVEVREIMAFPQNAASSPDRIAPPSPATDHSLTELNKSIVRIFNTAFMQQSDIAAFHEIVDPEVINHTAPPAPATLPPFPT